jgi:hypothetical protein
VVTSVNDMLMAIDKIEKYSSGIRDLDHWINPGQSVSTSPAHHARHTRHTRKLSERMQSRRWWWTRSSTTWSCWARRAVSP